MFLGQLNVWGELYVNGMIEGFNNNINNNNKILLESLSMSLISKPSKL